MIRFMLLASPLLIVATPAIAQQAGTDTAVSAVAPTAPAAAPRKPPKVCRTFAVTGRRIADTVCYTAAQWAELDHTNAEAANKLVNDVTSAQGRSDFRPGANGQLNTLSMFGIGPQ